MIKVAQSSDSGAFSNAIQQLPEVDNPKIFGLPTNIDRSVQRFNSNQVITQLNSLAAVSAAELRFDKEKWTETLGPLLQMWTNIYKGDQAYNDVQIEKGRSSDPVEQFVYMEMQSAIKLLSTVNQSITSITKVLQGTEMLTPKTEAEATQLMANTVPAAWEKQWEGPENPTAWIRIANKKGAALVKWVQAA